MATTIKIHYHQTLKSFQLWAFEQHDVVCNQKYDKRHPYSFHLEMVDKVAHQFQHLLKDDEEAECVFMAVWGHDLIEDARLTYNDVLQASSFEVAEIIYACTEEKGRNRAERHSDSYYAGLKANRLATYVKLCDIIANVKYSLLTNSSMYKKYKVEFEKFHTSTYRPEFDEMYDYLHRLLNVNL